MSISISSNNNIQNLPKNRNVRFGQNQPKPKISKNEKMAGYIDTAATTLNLVTLGMMFFSNTFKSLSNSKQWAIIATPWLMYGISHLLRTQDKK